MNPPDSQTLRILDANANRSREALRVLEDYARFVQNDGPLSAELKRIRHALAGLLSPLLGVAILHRDTPGDVGRENKTTREFQRESIADVVIAAGKRLGEALRAIEEYSKIIQPDIARGVERLRYSFYAVESRLALTLGRSGRFGRVRLYVLLTESACKRPWLDAAKAAIAGGADCIQLREKNLEAAEWLIRAKTLSAECRRAGVLFIVNDRVDIAIASDADGVHVGQQDLPPVEVRKLIGRDKLLGVSTHNLEQARQAVRDGADYIGLGPVFPSSTKPRDFLAGLQTLRDVTAAVDIPVAAIAGITQENVDDCLAAGASAVAVTAAVFGCDDVESATRRLKEKLEKTTIASGATDRA